MSVRRHHTGQWPQQRGSTFVIAFVLIVSLLLTVSDASPLAAADSMLPPTTVGLPVEMKGFPIPGPEVEPLPLNDDSPVIIRIDAVYQHGSGHRYDIAVSALEPGTFDLRDYLRRKDGTPVSNLPPLMFTAQSLLPAGQIEPHRPVPSRLPWLGGYRLLLGMLAVAWIGVMAWLIWPRRDSSESEDTDNEESPRSLADRLRPLISDAMAGRTSPAELAELERALVAFWRRQMGWKEIPADDVVSRLREHPETAPLLKQLETWLHRPAGSDSDVDINALLAPYADIPSDSLEREPALSGGSAR